MVSWRSVFGSRYPTDHSRRHAQWAYALRRVVSVLCVGHRDLVRDEAFATRERLDRHRGTRVALGVHAEPRDPERHADGEERPDHVEHRPERSAPRVEVELARVEHGGAQGQRADPGAERRAGEEEGRGDPDDADVAERQPEVPVRAEERDVPHRHRDCEEVGELAERDREEEEADAHLDRRGDAAEVHLPTARADDPVEHGREQAEEAGANEAVVPEDAAGEPFRRDDARTVLMVIPLAVARGGRVPTHHVLDLVGVGDAHRHGERGDARSVGRSHGGARPRRELLAAVLAALADGLLEDVHAGGGDGDLRAGVGEVREVVAAVRGAHGDGERSVGGGAHVVRLVASGADHDGALVVGVLDRLVHDPRVPGGAQGHVDDVRAVIGRPADALGHVGKRAAAAGVEHLHRHDRGAVGHARAAELVVGRLRDGARDVRAVALVVVGVGGVAHEVPAGDADRPGEVGEARVRPVVLAGHARVDDGHQGAATARDVRRVVEPHALHAPLLVVHGVVGHEERAHLAVDLHVVHVGAVAQQVERALHVSVRDPHDVEPVLGDHLLGVGPEGEVGLLTKRPDLIVPDIVIEIDHDLGRVRRRRTHTRRRHRRSSRGGRLCVGLGGESQRGQHEERKSQFVHESPCCERENWEALG